MQLCNTKYFALLKSSGSRLALALLALTLILLLPVAGGLWGGLPVSVWTEFPPRSQVVQHAPYHWWVFVALGVIIVSVVVTIVWRVVRSTPIAWSWNNGIRERWNAGEREIASQGGACVCVPVAQRPAPLPFGKGGRIDSLDGDPPSLPTVTSSNIPVFQHSIVPIPLWGWAGVVWMFLAWAVAWTRLPSLAWMQQHTYVLVWSGYIVTMLALTQQRTGTCMLTHRPLLLAGLAFVSAFFWWGFEFMNRGVQNWFYQNVENFSPLEYAVMATLSFMTVLPAVLATYDWLTTRPRLTAGLDNWFHIRFARPRLAGAGFALAGAVGLFFLPVYPNVLFPLLWLAPLALLCGLLAAAGETTLFDDLGHGDWSTLVRLSMAALICGFFWEMWNMHSLARWVYAVPYVGRFHLFEMPVLGFAGYGPFGWECAAVAMIFGLWEPKKVKR
jgi:hypothetical protein